MVPATASALVLAPRRFLGQPIFKESQPGAKAMKIADNIWNPPAQVVGRNPAPPQGWLQPYNGMFATHPLVLDFATIHGNQSTRLILHCSHIGEKNRPTAATPWVCLKIAPPESGA